MALTVTTTAPAAIDAPPTVSSVTIDGEPVVGGTLTAVAGVTGDPEPVPEYRWLRCEADRPNKCDTIGGATAASYVAVAGDLGSRLRVRVTATNALGSAEARSEPTAVVGEDPGPEPTPTPTPEPTPTPTPEPTPTATPTPEATATPEPSATPAPSPEPTATPGPSPTPAPTATPAPALTGAVPLPVSGGSPAEVAPRYLRPFPVVRIRGQLTDGGVQVTLLRVAAPKRARVRVSCRGDGCPAKSIRRRPGRIAAYERFLPAGMRIVVRVTRRERIGKYVRLRVRDGRVPARRDACLLPGSPRPAPCPVP